MLRVEAGEVHSMEQNDTHQQSSASGGQHEAGSGRPRCWKVALLFVGFGLVLVVVGVALAELGLRYQGREAAPDANPYLDDSYTRCIIEGAPRIGYRHVDGAFVVSEVTQTHLPGGIRVTGMESIHAEAGDLPEVWLFGCSITHGWALADEDTFAWRLQAMMPNVHVINFGTDGYSTVQSMLQFQQAVERRAPPEVAVLVYQDFHGERNVFSRNWWKHNRSLWACVDTPQPRAVLNGKDELQFEYVESPYRLLPFAEELALANLFDEMYTRWHDQRFDMEEVSRRVILAFDKLCRESGTQFIVTPYTLPDAPTPILAFCAEHEIPAYPVGTPYTEEYVIPEDGHPNARAAELAATRLHAILSEMLARETGEAHAKGAGRL